jgi:hypothetical protein
MLIDVSLLKENADGSAVFSLEMWENLTKNWPFPQREWAGLTHEELIEIYNEKDWDTTYGWDYEQAIEAKLKEKNT